MKKCEVEDCQRDSWARGMCLMHYKRVWRHGTLKVKRLANNTDAVDVLLHYGWEVCDSGCWEYLGHIHTLGYGSIHAKAVQYKAHRVSYEHFVGPIPSGAHLLHSCDNRKCINPEHLRPGTHQENMADMVSRGRAKNGGRGEKNPASKLTWEDVYFIRESIATGLHTQAELSRMFGCSQSNVMHIKRNQVWKEEHAPEWYKSRKADSAS